MNRWRRLQPRILGSSWLFAFVAAGLWCLAAPFGARADAYHLFGWEPAFGIASSFVSVGGFGSVSSSVRPADQGDADVQFPIYGLSLGLSSPPVWHHPNAPRLWGQVGLSSGLRAPQALAREGVPGPLLVPSDQTKVFTDDAVTGQGSVIEASFGSYFLNGSLGVSFDLEVLDRRLSIKPSFEWAVYQLRVEGLVARAFATVRSNPPGTPASVPQPVPRTTFRLVSLESFDRKVLHGIGPGLEVELEATRFGPIVSSVYISGQAYRLWGNREQTLSATFVDSVGTETANWQAKFHRWTYRGGLGIRLAWRPE